MIVINIDRLRHSIAVDGEGTKQIIAMEEMAELTQQISKVLRNQPDREHLIEEYADVLICLEMLKIIHDIQGEEIQKWIDYKLDRQAERDKRRIPNGKYKRQKQEDSIFIMFIRRIFGPAPILCRQGNDRPAVDGNTRILRHRMGG